MRDWGSWRRKVPVLLSMRGAILGLAHLVLSFSTLAGALPTGFPSNDPTPTQIPFFTAVWRRTLLPTSSFSSHTRGPEGWGHFLGWLWNARWFHSQRRKKVTKGPANPATTPFSPTVLVPLPLMLVPLNELPPFPCLSTTTNSGPSYFGQAAARQQPRPTKKHGPSFSDPDTGLNGWWTGEGGYKGDVQRLLPGLIYTPFLLISRSRI